MDAVGYMLGRYPDSSAEAGRRIAVRNGHGRLYAIISHVSASRAGASGSGMVDVLTIHVGDYLLLDDLLQMEGFIPAIGIGRGAWVSVRLDGSVDDGMIRSLIDRAHDSRLPEKEKPRAPKEWLIPANPAIWDILHGFDDTDRLEWKRAGGIRQGDTVYIYAGNPVAAILYRCHVESVSDKRILIVLSHRYDPDEFPRSLLRSCYGIYSVRNARGVPYALSMALEERAER